MGTKKTETKEVVIPRPNLKVAEFNIGGDVYVQHKFSAKAKAMIRATQEAGSKSTKNKKKVARDFEADYEGAKHYSDEGWNGIPASAFRNAMISACRVAGFTMTIAKLSVFVLGDGFDREDGTPLVRILTDCEPFDDKRIDYVRNQTGVIDLRARPMWKNWKAVVRVQYDGDQFGEEDVANLLLRVGMQVGIGEGRPDGKKSAGCGWGLFEIE